MRCWWRMAAHSEMVRSQIFAPSLSPTGASSPSPAVTTSNPQHPPQPQTPIHRTPNKSNPQHHYQPHRPTNTKNVTQYHQNDITSPNLKDQPIQRAPTTNTTPNQNNQDIDRPPLSQQNTANIPVMYSFFALLPSPSSSSLAAICSEKDPGIESKWKLGLLKYLMGASKNLRLALCSPFPPPPPQSKGVWT